MTATMLNMPIWNQLSSSGSFTGTWDEARTAAGIDWEPTEAKVLDEAGQPIEGWKRVTRGEGGRTLGIVKQSHPLITHSDMGEILSAVHEAADGDLNWLRIGELEQGRKVWALAEAPSHGRTVLGDDSETLPHIAVIMGHSGAGSFKVLPAAFRYRCANQLRSAELDARRADTVFTIRHTSNWRSRIKEAREAVHGSFRDFQWMTSELNLLAEETVTMPMVDQFLSRLFPVEDDAKNQQISLAAKKREAMRALWDAETNRGIEPTAYKLAQMITEYADHHRSNRGELDAVFTRTVLRSAPFKKRALSIVRDLVLAA